MPSRNPVLSFALVSALAAVTAAAGFRPVPASLAEHLLIGPDGAPLAGARVYAARFSNQFFGGSGIARWVNDPVIADADGKFRLSDPTVDRIIVLPSAKAARKRTTKSFPFFARLNKNTTRIVSPRSVPLTVRFRDGDGRPISGKEVMVFPFVPSTDSPRDSPEAERVLKSLPPEVSGFVIDTGFPTVPPELKKVLTTQTDADGDAFFAALPQNERISLTIDAIPEKQRPLVLAGNFLLTSHLTTAPILRLPLDGVITGQVLHRSTGHPLAGVRVSLYEPGPQGGMRALGPKTDAKGRFRFTGLYPALYSLSYEGGESEAGYTGHYLQTAPARVILTEAPSQSLSVRPDFIARQDISVAKAAQVQVTVRDSAGRPAFAQEVSLEGKNGGMGGLTDLYGKITLSDLPGKRQVAWARGRSKKGGEDTVRKPITLREGETQTVAFGPAAKRDALLRAMAPDFTGRDVSGKAVHLSSFRGKVVVLDFVYLNEGQTSDLDALRQAEAAARLVRPDADRVVFLAVCTGSGDDSGEPIWTARKIAALKAAFPHIRFVRNSASDPATIPTVRYHISGWPQRFVIGPYGTLRNSYGSSGYGAADSDYAPIMDRRRLLRDIRVALP